MVSHRRPGVVARALGLRRSPEVIPAPRRVGIELVDARSRLTHWVSPDTVIGGYGTGACRALCGSLVLAASLTEPGCGWCRYCRALAAPGGRR
jgi:hypothetical protein